MPRPAFTPPCGFDIAHTTLAPADLARIAGWGHRLVVHPSGTQFLHEAYYDGDDALLGLALTPARACGDAPDEVREALEAMTEAFAEPPLQYADFVSDAPSYGRYADEVAATN